MSPEVRRGGSHRVSHPSETLSQTAHVARFLRAASGAAGNELPRMVDAQPGSRSSEGLALLADVAASEPRLAGLEAKVSATAAAHDDAAPPAKRACTASTLSRTLASNAHVAASTPAPPTPRAEPLKRSASSGSSDVSTASPAPSPSGADAKADAAALAPFPVQCRRRRASGPRPDGTLMPDRRSSLHSSKHDPRVDEPEGGGPPSSTRPAAPPPLSAPAQLSSEQAARIASLDAALWDVMGLAAPEADVSNRRHLSISTRAAPSEADLARSPRLGVTPAAATPAPPPSARAFGAPSAPPGAFKALTDAMALVSAADRALRFVNDEALQLRAVAEQLAAQRDRVLAGQQLTVMQLLAARHALAQSQAETAQLRKRVGQLLLERDQAPQQKGVA